MVQNRDTMNNNTLNLLKTYNPEIVDFHFEDEDKILVFDGNDNVIDSFTLAEFEEKFCPDCINFKGNL